MLFAIDWDNTYTRDVTFFMALRALIEQHGHRCVIVTNRGPSWPLELDPQIPVIYCSSRPKRQVCREHDLSVDVWIDDLPILVDLGERGLEAVRMLEAGGRMELTLESPIRRGG